MLRQLHPQCTRNWLHSSMQPAQVTQCSDRTPQHCEAAAAVTHTSCVNQWHCLARPSVRNVICGWCKQADAKYPCSSRGHTAAKLWQVCPKTLHKGSHDLGRSRTEKSWSKQHWLRDWSLVSVAGACSRLRRAVSVGPGGGGGGGGTVPDEKHHYLLAASFGTALLLKPERRRMELAERVCLPTPACWTKCSRLWAWGCWPALLRTLGAGFTAPCWLAWESFSLSWGSSAGTASCASGRRHMGLAQVCQGRTADPADASHAPAAALELD